MRTKPGMLGRPAAALVALSCLLAAWGCGPEGDARRAGRRRVAGSAGALHIELRETAGLERRFEPVRAGLPFPRGALAGPGNLRVVLSDGREVASQRRVMARWPDGSVRWLELCFGPSVAAGAVGRYRVEFAPRLRAGKVPAPLRASGQGGVILVDTGRLRLRVGPARGGGGPALSAWLDGDGDGKYAPGEQVLAEPGLEPFVELQALKKGALAGRYPAAGGAPRLEEAGPLRAVVAWRGWHADRKGRRVCPYLLRLYAFRGRSCLRLVHTLTLSEDPAASRVAEAGLALRLRPGKRPLAGRALRQGVAGPKRYPDLAGFKPRFRLLEGQKVLAEGGARGFLEARSERFHLTAAVPRAAEDAPWELRLDPGSSRLVAAFWPRWGGPFTDARSLEERGEPGFLEFTRTESYERFWPKEAGPGPGRSAVGASRTHELWISFASGAAGSGGADFAARVASPLVPWPGADWLDRSGAFGRFRPRGGGPNRKLAVRTARGAERLSAWLRLHRRERFGWLGLWDYGDCQTIYRRRGDLDVGARWWNWHGRWGWTQGRGGLARAFLVPWLTRGRPAGWEAFRAAVEHNIDVDTVRPAGRPAGMAGATHGPGATHWSSPAALAWTHPAAWLDYYHLSGERRALEALAVLVGSLGGKTIGDFGEKGRPYTADQAGYLRARLAAHEALGKAQAGGARAALNYFAGLSGRELGFSELWARGVAPALVRYHRIFGDETAARLIERGTRAYISSRGPAGRGGRPPERNCFESCAYSWRLTGDRYFLERGRQLAERSAAFRAGGLDLKAPERVPAGLSTDTREILELASLPYLMAALEGSAAGR